MVNYKKQGQKVIEAEGNLGEVWISGSHFARDIKGLEDNKINAVCTVAEVQFKFPEHFKHMAFHIEDSFDQKISFSFVPAFEFIDKSRKQGNVLIHCFSGISRSSTILTSYMMQKYKMSLDQCLQKIREKRPCIEPNFSFKKELL